MVEPKTNPTDIGLIFTHSFAYYRRILRGIWRYVEARPQWDLTSLAPEQRPLRTRGQFSPDGLIVALNTTPLERALRSWERPAVNVSAIFSRHRFPRVGVDNLEIRESREMMPSSPRSLLLSNQRKKSVA